jgi:16S rRNA (adenine1518-N6/adenine1519-N6)-dimethyltransferase
MKKFINSEFEHKARKRFGQNFLIDDNIISNIVRAIAPRKDDVLVEIGPGKGAITQLLSEATDYLRVIELDRDLVPWLKVKFEQHPDFQLFQADALKFDFAQLIKPQQRFRIVGNLPYNISTPLIFHLLTYTGAIDDMHFMLQKEVVKRMAALPGESAYGRLGIMVQYFCQVDDLFDVPPESFDPAPKVDSAIVRLIPHKELPCKANHFATFEKLVNVAFQQRRKTLRNSLKQWVSAEQMESLPVDISLRPEEISLADYVAISNALGEL